MNQKDYIQRKTNEREANISGNEEKGIAEEPQLLTGHGLIKSKHMKLTEKRREKK